MAFRLFALIVVMCGATRAFSQAVCYQFSGSQSDGTPFVATVNISHIPASTASASPGFVYGASFNSSSLPSLPGTDNSPQDIVTVTSGGGTLSFQVFSIVIVYNAYGNDETQFQLGGRSLNGIFPTGSVNISVGGKGNLLPYGLVPALPSVPAFGGYVSASLTGGPELGGQITSIGLCSPPDCQIPTAETTAFNGWGNGYYVNNAAGRWKQTLVAPGNVSFSGRSIKETATGVGADSCYFDGSLVSPFTSVTNVPSNTPWTVNSDNMWGDDFVGWSADAIAYYRLKGRAPCGAAFLQQMVISCPDGSFHNYGTANVLAPSFTGTTATSVRAGGTATRRY